MSDLKKLAEHIGPEKWELAIGLHGSAEDVKRLGHYVYKPNWGTVACTPKDSPQFSRHSTLMEYIAAASPKHVLELFTEIERLRAEVEQAERRAAKWEAALRELSGEAPLSEALAQKEASHD